MLIKKGYDEDALPSNITFKRFAEHFRRNHYAEWVLRREGMKAYHDKVEPYIERDISKIEVGDVLIADGHVLNFQVINPFTGKPTRATLVGFLDWKSTAFVGYEIMMTENTQCIASALRNAIINLGIIPKVVYQDNGKAFNPQEIKFIEGLLFLSMIPLHKDNFSRQKVFYLKAIELLNDTVKIRGKLNNEKVLSLVRSRG